jgi:hypothetical protein
MDPERPAKKITERQPRAAAVYDATLIDADHLE